MIEGTEFTIMAKKSAGIWPEEEKYEQALLGKPCEG
jgi:hypothetical protein